jgi:tRNA (guanine37-N1)-methyltransferase
MGSALSGQDESFERGRLEYPHYHPAARVEGLAIPAVLSGGDHGAIARWRESRRCV